MTQNLAVVEESGASLTPAEDQAKDLRVPPHNYEAEKALLGALLHNNQAYEKVSEYLIPEHFADSAHGKIYEAISSLVEHGQVADPITLRDYFEREEALAEVGGTEFLAQLAGSVVSVINVKDYGSLIHDLAIRRQLINLGEGVVNDSYTPRLKVSAQDLIESTEQQLYDLATAGQTERGFVPFSSALTQSIQSAEVAFKRDSHVVGVATGLMDLDRHLGGLHPSDLIILAGRPSMGKTALATNIAFNAACAFHEKNEKEGAQVAFFSLEMSAEQIATRLLGQEARISSDKIRRGELKKDDFPNFVDVSRRLASIPLYIDDTPALSVSGLRTRARRLKRKSGLGLIVVDYLQLLGVAPGSRADSRVQEVSEMTRALKGLAKELDVPIILLSQLSRAVEQRDDKRPQLADLRESGSIEQDADIVMFVYREEYYEARKEPPMESDKHAEWQERMSKIHNVAEVIVSKQRHGPIGTVKVHFEGPLTKFSDLVKEDHLPDVAP